MADGARMRRESHDQRPHQHAPAPAGGQSPPSKRLNALDVLQRSYGNRAVNALLDGRGTSRGQVVQRGGEKPPDKPADKPAGDQAGAGLDFVSMNALAVAGVQLSREDEKLLATQYPNGIVLGGRKEMILGMRFGDRLDGYRVTAYEINSPVPAIERGVESYIFQVGKGRAILVSSIGGGSVLMDAGTFQTTSLTAPSVQRLASAVRAVTSGPAQIPETFRLSHADADHYNTGRAILSQAGFANTTIEVALQQMRSAGGGWAGMTLNVHPTQRVVEINVTDTGGGIHMRRVVIGNMQLTEFRSVAAHQALADPDIQKYNRNRTSPVTVVRDLLSGERSLFTADAEGRQFDEIVNAIGRTAFMEILGAEGHNLTLVEDPHHFGKQAGPDARGMINMLQLAYESGEGSVRLVAQTTQRFATKPSSTFNFLDVSGLAPERIERDPAGGTARQVTRARGSELARVTLDLAGTQRALEVINANETVMRQTYARLAELDSMRSDAVAVAESLKSGTAPAPLQSSVQQTAAEITRMHDDLRASVGVVWDRMRAAAAPEGMRGDADVTQIRAALTDLTARLPTQDAALATARNDLETHRAGLTLYSRMSYNGIKLLTALQADDVEELFKARAEHNDLVRAARAALGPTVVHEHVTAAWEATRAEWPPERFEARTSELSAEMAQREMTAEFHSLVSETLGRQLELNKIVAEAETAGRQVYGPNGRPMTPVGARRGAGMMAAIEIVRIGLDCFSQYKAGAAAKAEEAARGKREGVATMAWWMRLGVTPRLALASSGIMSSRKYDIVYEADQELAQKAALSDTSPPGVPDFDKVVVTGVDGDELRRLVYRAIVELNTLQDWNTFVAGCPAGRAFRQYDDQWGVRLWDRDDRKYGYIKAEDISPGITNDLNRLHVELDKAQQGALETAVAAPGAGTVKSVEDTAWVFGHDRRVWVYDEHGSWNRFDFDSDKPRFLYVATVDDPPRLDGTFAKVRAADLETYKTLSAKWWMTWRDSYQIDAYGVQHRDVDFEPNVNGYCYVKPSQLIEAG